VYLYRCQGISDGLKIGVMMLFYLRCSFSTDIAALCDVFPHLYFLVHIDIFYLAFSKSNFLLGCEDCLVLVH
jgi:hypothetical protein